MVKSLRVFWNRYWSSFAVLLTFAIAPSLGFAQTGHRKPATKNSAKTQKAVPIPKKVEYSIPGTYYHLAGLGSTPGDSVNSFPYPTAILQLTDASKYIVRVRFPGLGMLGIQEDTVWSPNVEVGDSLSGYRPMDALYLLTFPKTEYMLFVDVLTKDSSKVLDTRPLAYTMGVQTYKTASLRYIHEPTTGMGSPNLRRRFEPTLLPFSLETNPGWASMETLDSNMVYALAFRNPEEPTMLALSVTMRPVLVGTIDSSMWEDFKEKARQAFGSKGIAVSSIGDFQVDDLRTRRFIKSGYEFISKNQDGSMDYVAAFLTPRATLLLLAPVDPKNSELSYSYLRSIARSLKLD